MDTILFLLAPQPSIGPLLLADVMAHLKEAGVRLGEHDWLNPATACRIPCQGIVDETLVRKRLGDAPVDVVILPAALCTPKAVLLADMDSTLITTESLDELAAVAGLKHEVAAITARAMNGELDFAQALQERVAMLKGLPASALEKVVSDTVFMPGAGVLAATMKAHGAHCVVVSGGFTPFTGHVRRVLGFDEDVANTLEVENGVLTGRVTPPILDRHAKLATLERLAAMQRDGHKAILAVGDGANDLPMLQAAGLGVAFRAKPVVASACSVRIQHCGLDALLYLQGLRQAQFRQP
jgi:phosphoserine phosphatase